MILYTNWFIPKGFAALTLGPVVLIRPHRRGDEALVAHEKVHIRQFWQSYGLFWIWYLGSKKRRLAYEVEAYREQLRYRPKNLALYASALASKYRLGISVEEAVKLLTKE